MSIVACLIAVQANAGTGNGQFGTSSTLSGWYFVIALLALMLGLVVLMFVRTSVRRHRNDKSSFSSREAGAKVPHL